MHCNISTFARNRTPMLLKDFFSRFTNEDDCISYFKEIRHSVGIVCPKCGCTSHKWVERRSVFQCMECGNWTTLTQGTVMEKSHLPLYPWFFTAHMMTSFKQVLSAKEIQHQLEMKYYPPAWLMMMKYRDIMGQRDSLYKMADQIELDISYFPTSSITNKDGEKTRKRRKTGVLVMAESRPVDEIMLRYLTDLTDTEKVNKASILLAKSSQTKIKKAVRYIKMRALPDIRFETIKPFVTAAVKDDAKVLTDGGHNLLRLEEVVGEHEAHLETETDAHDVVTKILPWVHIVTGEYRSGIEAIHKDIDERFLQLYLNEYCWKFNRRFFRDSKENKYDLFERLIRIAAQYASNIKWRNHGTEINGY